MSCIELSASKHPTQNYSVQPSAGAAFEFTNTIPKDDIQETNSDLESIRIITTGSFFQVWRFDFREKMNSRVYLRF